MSTSVVHTGASVDLRYGDSLTGTHASGPVVRDTVAIAGLSMEDQVFASVNDTDNSAVQNGGAGIFGLGFPSQRYPISSYILDRLLRSFQFRTSSGCQ